MSRLTYKHIRFIIPFILIEFCRKAIINQLGKILKAEIFAQKFKHMNIDEQNFTSIKVFQVNLALY